MNDSQSQTTPRFQVTKPMQEIARESIKLIDRTLDRSTSNLHGKYVVFERVKFENVTFSFFYHATQITRISLVSLN